MTPDTLLPLLGAVVLTLVLPALLVPRNTLSQGALARGVVATAVVILLAGAGLFAGLYLAGGKPVAELAAAAPVWTAVYFLQRSALLALFWGPLLALVWLVRAQAVNHRRGQAAAERK